MPAAGTPFEERSFLAHPLGLLTGLVVRAPRATLLAAVVLAVVSVSLGVTRLEMHTSRLDLLNPHSPYNKLWLEYIEEFGGDDDAVVVVQGASREEVLPALEAVGEHLRRDERHFRSVLDKVDLSTLRAKRLHYLDPQQLGQLEQFLFQVQPIAAGDWSSLQLSRLVEGLGRASASPDPQMRQHAQSTLAQHVENLHQALHGGDGYASPWGAMSLESADDPFKTQYLLTDDGRIGLVLLRLAIDSGSFDRGTAAIDHLRKLLADIDEQHPEVQIGLTGLPVMENDEMRASERCTIEASVVSLVGVAVLFMVGFGGLRHPLLTVATLVLALCWCFAYIVATIGHLNILSMSFGIILIGLGIDFGIHYVARYLHERQTNRDTASALVATADAVGPGVVTGGVTTAIAFFAAGLTDFTGVAELGVIAGGGILLCLTGAMFVLPAMIQLSDGNRRTAHQPRLLGMHRWFGFAALLPITTLVVSLGVVGISCLGLKHLWYDHNLLNLQPTGLESVQLEQRLLEETDQSVWFAISLCNTREELLARKARFMQLDSVERTEEIASLLPSDDPVKAERIARIGQQLAALPDRPPQIPLDAPAELAHRLAAAQSQFNLAPGSPLQQKWSQVVQTLGRQPLPECYRALTAYQTRLTHDLLHRLQGLRAASNPSGPSLEDLPESLVDRFVGGSGRYLLKVYSKADIWDMDALREFVREVRSVDPRATGQPLQTYEASRQMQRSYVHAALYALIAVSMVLVIDFRSIRYSLLALFPVGLGMLQMFGLLGLLGIPLNPANMIVLPLILGIGLDDGVHVLHDFRRQQGRYRLSRSTATAVVITSLTTMVGFGSMMIADHRGLESLGRVLTLGVACCLFMSLVPLPALLAWISRHDSVPATPAPSEREPVTEVEPAEEPVAVG